MAEEYRTDVAFAKLNPENVVAGAGLEFPAQELLDILNTAIEVIASQRSSSKPCMRDGGCWTEASRSFQEAEAWAIACRPPAVQ